MSSEPIREEDLGEEEEDLGALARTTLSGVQVNDLPPEPLALGVDLGRLATTSRPPAPPSRKDDSDARIDLRPSSPGSVAAPAPNASRPPASRPSTPAELAARLRSSRAPAPPAKPASAVVVFTPNTSPPPAHELDDLIASRAFSPTAALATSAQRWLAAARNAPAWTWPLCGGLAIGLVIGLALAGDDGAELAQVPIAAAEPASYSAPATGTPVLPQVVATSRGSAQASAPASRERARTSSNRGAAHASSPAREPSAAPAQVAAAPATGEPRSIDTLLDQAIGGGAHGAATPPTAATSTRASNSDANLPTTPERAEVASTLGALLPRIRFCGGSRAGVATAQIVVKSTGRISSVRIMGPPFSRTTAARCMERVIRGASFAPFRQASFKVTYPYSL